MKTLIFTATVLVLFGQVSLADESYRAADLIDTTGDYVTEQKVSEYSYNTIKNSISIK